MAVRYVEIGQYPDVRREVRGNLSEILASTANPGTYAAPEDVTGTFLEKGTDGKWYGDLGELGTTGFRDSLFTGYLALGVTCKVSGVPYSWSGAGWQGTLGPYLGSAENPYPASTTTAELVALAAISKPGQIIYITNPALPLIGYSRMQRTADSEDFDPVYLPIPGEAVFGESGGVFSQSGGFSDGTSILAYSGPEIPDCLIPSSGSFALEINAGVSDGSSTASTSLGCGVSQAAAAPTDFNYSIVTQTAAVNTMRMGMFSPGRGFRRTGTEIIAFAATYGSVSSPEIVIGYAPGSGLRFRFYVKAGASTNVVDIVSYSATWRPG